MEPIILMNVPVADARLGARHDYQQVALKLSKTAHGDELDVVLGAMRAAVMARVAERPEETAYWKQSVDRKCLLSEGELDPKWDVGFEGCCKLRVGVKRNPTSPPVIGTGRKRTEDIRQVGMIRLGANVNVKVGFEAYTNRDGETVVTGTLHWVQYAGPSPVAVCDDVVEDAPVVDVGTPVDAPPDDVPQETISPDEIGL